MCDSKQRQQEAVVPQEVVSFSLEAIAEDAKGLWAKYETPAALFPPLPPPLFKIKGKRRVFPSF